MVDIETTGKIRDEAYTVSPTFLRGTNLSKLIWAMAVPYDALLDGETFAVLYRFPSFAPDDAFTYIGQDRQITQGFQEGRASYILRLQQWLDRWRYAGKTPGVLIAIRGWITPQLPKIEAIKDSPKFLGTTTWISYADGVDPWPSGDTPTPPTQTPVSPRNFNWDNNYPLPTIDAQGRMHLLRRMFLVIFSTVTSWCQSTLKWGSPGLKWGLTGLVWGFDQDISVTSGLFSLVKQWKGAHAWYQWIIVSFDGTLFDPAQPADGIHNPDGTFGRWSKIVNGQYVPARFASARYINGPDWPTS